MMYNIIKSGSGQSLLDGAGADKIIETTTNGEELSSYGCARSIRETIRRLCSVRLARKKRKPEKQRIAPGQSIRPGI